MTECRDCLVTLIIAKEKEDVGFLSPRKCRIDFNVKIQQAIKMNDVRIRKGPINRFKLILCNRPRCYPFQLLRNRLLAAILLAIASHSVSAVETPFLVEQLRDDHPKILASEADFERIRAGFSDELGQEMLSFLQMTGESLLTAEPAQFKLAGKRLLNESRLALKHISTFALLYRVYGEGRYK